MPIAVTKTQIIYEHFVTSQCQIKIFDSFDRTLCLYVDAYACLIAYETKND